MDENNRRFLDLNEVLFPKPQLAVSEMLLEYSQSSGNAPIAPFGGGNLILEFHLNENDAAYRSFVVGEKLPQIGVPHPADAAIAGHRVALLQLLRVQIR